MKLPPACARPWSVPLVLVASSLSARAEVWVVDKAAAPGSDFTEIQPAVNAAVSGDTLLVRNGSYAQFAIDGKSLSVVADGDGVTVHGGDSFFFSSSSIYVQNLAPDQQVLVRGIRATTGVQVLNCGGAVWFDELLVSGDVYCAPGGTAGAWVKTSARVTFTRCMLRGESNSDPWLPHPPADGLRAEAATVQLFDCEIRGGWGDSGSAGIGGPGMRVDASTVTVIGCTIVGGEGGTGNPGFGSLCTGTHGRGGAGVQFVGTAGSVRSAESTAAGGVLSLEPMCPGLTGPPGPAIAGTGTIVALPGFARHLRANGPVRGGETLTLEVGGQPGEIPLVFVSFTHAPLPLLNSTLLVGLPPTDVFVLGQLPASGQASLSFPVPNVGAVESFTCYAQSVFLDPSLALWLGAGTSVVLLGAGL